MTIAIIGGGAAGMMAMATILEHDSNARVILIERNTKLGNKVIISGGGRCNVTTGIRSMKTLFTKYPRGSKFLTSAFYGFPPENVYEWFEAHGVPLKIEKDLRVFPISNDGHDIVGVFEKMSSSKRVDLKLSHTVQAIKKDGDVFTITCKDKPEITADKVIIATGGQAYRHTGSQGDGYTFAEMLGHSITDLAPSLSSYIIRDEHVKELAGVSWGFAQLSTPRTKKEKPEGPFMFTHSGITGPVVFAFSALYAFEKIASNNPLPILINLFPETPKEKTIEIFTNQKIENGRKSTENTLATIVPKSIAHYILISNRIDPLKNIADCTKKELEKIVDTIHGMPFHVIGRGAGDEFVTAGGVETSEVSPQRMESLITPGLFFAGEILNIDGFTGGYNLQASWATGRLAGLHAIE